MIDNRMIRAAAAVLVLTGSLVSLNAQAAVASASATVFDLTDSSGLLSFSNYSYLVDASTPTQSGFSAGSSPSYYSFTESSGSNYSYAEAGVDSVFNMPTTVAGAYGAGKGASTAAWYLDWVSAATGTVNLDLSYLSSWTVSGLQAGETGIASSSISLLVDGTPYKSELLNFYNNVNGNNSSISDLYLSFAVIAGQTGSISIALASNAITAPVPLPAGVWLFGSGLLGMGRFVRRRVVAA